MNLPDSYLQDVQEEDEEPARGSGIAKMLELSGCSQGDSGHTDGEETEIGKLKFAIEELQAQNTMFEDELTLLRNVKGELEAELERSKEEFQMEKEELEFKIDELQMSRDGASNEQTVTVSPEGQEDGEEEGSISSKSTESEMVAVHQNLKTPMELSAQCEALTMERDSALAECQHMRGILQGFETELGKKPEELLLQYKTMKEEEANTVKELQSRIEELIEEKGEVLERMTVVTEERNSLEKSVQGLRLQLEEEQKLQSSVEEQTALTLELKQSVVHLTAKNEEILSQLQMKENVTQDLKEMVNVLSEEKYEVQSQLQQKEEEMKHLNEEKTKEIQKLLEEREKEALLYREEKEKELTLMKNVKEEEVQRLKEERENVEQSMKEEAERKQEKICSLEVTVKDLSTENSDLQKKLEKASSGLSKNQETVELLGSKLAALEAQLEQEMSEKHDREVKSLEDETDQTHSAVKASEEKQEAAELQARVEELEKERSMLKRRLEEAQGAASAEEVQKELQARITDLEQERNMLRNNLEEVLDDTKGLQKDLEEMKTANEKVCIENQKLLSQISLMTEEREEKEDEGKDREVDALEEEMRELKEQLTEKEMLITQLKSQVESLQVSGAPNI